MNLSNIRKQTEFKSFDYNYLELKFFLKCQQADETIDHGTQKKTWRFPKKGAEMLYCCGVIGPFRTIDR